MKTVIRLMVFSIVALAARPGRAQDLPSPSYFQHRAADARKTATNATNKADTSLAAASTFAPAAAPTASPVPPSTNALGQSPATLRPYSSAYDAAEPANAAATSAAATSATTAAAQTSEPLPPPRTLQSAAPAQTTPAAPMNAAPPADFVPQPRLVERNTTGDPQLKLNPLTVMREFQPAADEEYRLGRGDEITIDYAGHTEMQAKLIIGPDGRVTLPLAGDIILNNLTRPEAARAIESAMSTYYQNLAAQVTVTKYTANRVLVLGAVATPGLVSFEGQPTLLQALTRAGMSAGPTKIAQVPERCAIYRGQDQVVWVELKKLVDSGNSLADLRLRRDDVIYVPSLTENFVSVLGAVQKPGPVLLSSSSSLSSVLAEAGGFTKEAGNKPHIQIVDPAAGLSREISFNDLLNPAKALEIRLKPGQMIYVPQSGFSRATYILERLAPLVTAGTFAATARGVL